MLLGEGVDGLEEVVDATWFFLRLHGADGRPVTVDPAPFTYRMVRSTDYERLVHGHLARSEGGRLLRATAEAVRDVPGGAEVRCTLPGGWSLTLRARRVFDSRPPRSLPPPGPGCSSTSAAGSSAPTPHGSIRPSPT